MEAQSIFIDREKLDITSILFSDIIGDIIDGNKIREFYTLKDWIFTSEYYHGRHIFYLLDREFWDRFARQIIETYKIRYLVDSDITSDINDISESIFPYKNKVFASTNLDIYDFEGGRA